MPHRSAYLQVFQEGPAGAKGALAGILTILAALWGTVTSVIFAGLLFFWLMDMVSGILRALDLYGLAGFDGARFWRGFRKAGAAAVAVGTGVVFEVLARELGVTWAPVGATVMSVVLFGFFWSTLQNLNHWWPEISETVRKALDRGNPQRRRKHDPPKDLTKHQE